MSGSTLLVSTQEAYLNLPDPGELGDVVDLHIGARLYRAVPFYRLANWIGRFPSLQVVRLADDWIADEDMDSVKDLFLAAFPGKRFDWTQDLLAGGKHGR